VRKRCRKSGRACARLEGWGGDTPHASRRIAAQPSCGRVRARLGCDAPQHEGERGVCGTNLRLWETIAGSVPLFWDCYLQWKAQLQRVEPQARAPPRIVRRCCVTRGSMSWRGAGGREPKLRQLRDGRLTAARR